mgnify:CR=1 FL=1
MKLYEKVEYVILENKRTITAAKHIENNDLIQFGKLMYESHKGLTEKYKVSCEELDFLVDHTKPMEQVYGARMMGGGFGGCTINLISEDAVEGFKAKIQDAFSEKYGRPCSIYDVKISKGTHLIS